MQDFEHYKRFFNEADELFMQKLCTQETTSSTAVSDKPIAAQLRKTLSLLTL
jgi:hypothetical protein